jgi:hypothetical protein
MKRPTIFRLIAPVLLCAAFLSMLVAADPPTYINAGALRCGWTQRPNNQVQAWCFEGIVFNSETMRFNASYVLPPTGEPAIATYNYKSDVVTWKFSLTGTVLSYEVAVNGSSTLLIVTMALPGAVVGQPYSAQIVAVGGTPPYTWSVISGELPAGFSLSADGVLSGTPTTTGTWSFTAQVKDRVGASAVFSPSPNKETAPARLFGLNQDLLMVPDALIPVKWAWVTFERKEGESQGLIRGGQK